MSSDPTKGHLLDTLMLAFPIWVYELQKQGLEYVAARAKVCGPVIAERGDILQFRSKTPGSTAEVFNRMAEGLACLAIMAGQVDFMGYRFTKEGHCQKLAQA